MAIKERINKIVAIAILVAIIGLNFFWVRPADAQFGIPQTSFTLGDVPRLIYNVLEKIAKQYLKVYKKRLLTMLQNDLVNYVQGGGKPRFITNPGKFFSDAAKSAAVQAMDDYFRTKGKDICAPFRASVNILVNRATILPEERSRCTLGDIQKNLEDFKNNFTKGGGWKTWISLHEQNNTLPGAYLGAIQTVDTKAGVAGNAAQAQLSAGKGFLDKKICARSKMTAYFETEEPDTEILRTIDTIITNREGKQADINFPGTGITQIEVDYSGAKNGGVDMDLMGATDAFGITLNEVCTQTTTVTPGSIIGEGVSGLFKGKTDALINAKEIGEILDAVIDAAINRAMRDGLSLMKTGRGSYTKPKTGGGSYKDRARAQEETMGLEGVQAAEVLDTATGLSTKVGILEGTLDKFIAGDTKIDRLARRLDNMPDNMHSQKCSSEKAPGTAAKIERCFYNKERVGVDLNKEENNPGPYLGNKVLYEKLAVLWDKIYQIFQKRDSLSCPTGPHTNYTLSPEEDDLPIIGGDGTGFVWQDDNAYYGSLGNLPIKNQFGEVAPEFTAFITEAESLKIKYATAAATYNTVMENNREKKRQLQDDKQFINNALPGISLYVTVLMDYDRAGRNITAGVATTSLVAVIKKYTAALGSRDDNALDEAKTLLEEARRATETNWRNTQKKIIDIDEGRVTPGEGESYTAEEVIKARKKLSVIDRAITLISESSPPILIAQRITTTDPLETVSTPVTNLSAGDVVLVRPGIVPVDGLIVRMRDRDDTIVDGKSILDESKLEFGGGRVEKGVGATVFDGSTNLGPNSLEVEVRSVIDKSAETGLTPSEAVAKAVLDLGLVPQSIEQTRSELELRDGKISRQQSDEAAKLGKFPTTKEDRIQAGMDLGESEWEKYFYNRFQYAYASIIYDYYLYNNGGSDLDGNPIRTNRLISKLQELSCSIPQDQLDFRPVTRPVGP